MDGNEDPSGRSRVRSVVARRSLCSVDPVGESEIVCACNGGFESRFTDARFFFPYQRFQLQR